MENYLKLLEKIGILIEPDGQESQEDIENLILNKIDEQKEHITQLESENETLSKSNQELSASVEGEKAEKEKLDRELTETKGKLAQISEMYKEQFSQDPEEPESNPKDEKQLGDDVLAQLLGK